MNRPLDQTRVARVAACAVGLAFAARSEREVIDRLLVMAEREPEVLATATRRLARLEHVDQALRARAIVLLAASIRALDSSAAQHRPAPGTHGPTGWRGSQPASAPVGAPALRPPAEQEER